MGELIDAISADYRRKSSETKEPVTDAKVLSFLQQKCEQMFARKKSNDSGFQASVISFRFEISESPMASVIRATQNPVFSSAYRIVQEGRQSNGSYIVTVYQKELG